LEEEMLDQLDTFESHVRERAFALWEEAGCPENRAEEFWHRAREIEKQDYKLSESDLEKAAKAPSPDKGAADFA
jgi:hypothetical protein